MDLHCSSLSSPKALPVTWRRALGLSSKPIRTRSNALPPWCLKSFFMNNDIHHNRVVKFCSCSRISFFGYGKKRGPAQRDRLLLHFSQTNMLDEIAYGPVGETFCMSGYSTETQEGAACSQAGDASGMKMVKNSRGEEIGEGNCCVDAGLEISTVRMEDFSEEYCSVEFSTRTGVWSRLEWRPQNVPHVELSRDECHAANREMELSDVGYVIGIDNSWLQYRCFRVFS